MYLEEENHNFGEHLSILGIKKKKTKQTPLTHVTKSQCLMPAI